MCLKYVRNIISENHVCVWSYKAARNRVRLYEVEQVTNEVPMLGHSRSVDERFGTHMVDQMSRSQTKELKRPVLIYSQRPRELGKTVLGLTDPAHGTAAWALDYSQAIQTSCKVIRPFVPSLLVTDICFMSLEWAVFKF